MSSEGFKSGAGMERRAKIVATLGRATDALEILAELFDAGMAVARVNCSHGAPREHAARLRLLRRMELYWGVRPLYMPRAQSTERMVEGAARRLCEMGAARRGDVIAGTPIAHRGTKILLKVHRIE